MTDKAPTDAPEFHAVGGVPFGPGFFLSQLQALARDCCPDPAEGLPSVTLHLTDGETLELCHVMGLAPGFLALAVLDSSKAPSAARNPMRTELLPYAAIFRITIRPRREAGMHVGFDPGHDPVLIDSDGSPEESLRALLRKPGS